MVCTIGLVDLLRNSRNKNKINHTCYEYITNLLKSLTLSFLNPFIDPNISIANGSQNRHAFCPKNHSSLGDSFLDIYMYYNHEDK